MTLSPSEAARLAALKRKAEELGLDGVFTSVPGQGVNLEEAVMLAWKAGYIPVPTVEALLKHLEEDFARKVARTNSAQGPAISAGSYPPAIERIGVPNPNAPGYVGTYSPPPAYGSTISPEGEPLARAPYSDLAFENQNLKRQLRLAKFEGAFFGLGFLGTIFSMALLEGGYGPAGVAVSWFASGVVAQIVYGGD